VTHPTHPRPRLLTSIYEAHRSGSRFDRPTGMVLYWPGQPVTAIYVKRAGIVGLAGTFMTYGVALLTVTGPSGVVVGIELLGLSVACLVRAIQISRITRRIVARSAVLDATDAYDLEKRRRQEPPA
jgi:hypothetical protein